VALVSGAARGIGAAIAHKNRVLVLAHWTTAFLSSGRSEGAITEQQVFGRQALAASIPGGEVVG
jgi:NAD(P)-dependent dehydrogenase (short-subunit alcohol dehydrogenase family)